MHTKEKKFVLIILAIKPQGKEGNSKGALEPQVWSNTSDKLANTGSDELPATKKDKIRNLEARTPCLLLLDDFLFLKLERHVLFLEIIKDQLSQEQEHGSGIQAVTL